MESHCDLVMKGGITSGIVYPRLIARLAAKYRFKNIGGTSAGAIAAGACAAAEYARGQGRMDGFERLAQLPRELMGKATPRSRSRLFALFQPAPALRPHFAVLVRALNQQPRAAIAAVLGGIAAIYKGLLAAGIVLGSVFLWPWFTALAPGIGWFPLALGALAAACLTALLALAAGRDLLRGRRLQPLLCLAALLLAVAVDLAFVSGKGLTLRLVGPTLGAVAMTLLFLAGLMLVPVWLFLRGLLRGLHGNHYGICSGSTPPGSAQEGLTDWLARYFNEVAGLPADGAPLTFGHLWGHDDPAAPRAVNLEMMTTAISQHMAYGIPFREGTPPFYYDPGEWATLFPPQVMAQLDGAQFGSASDPPLQALSPAGKPLRPLPRGAGLPVVVAVRMSLSFPLLLSAMPLYAIDWSMKASADAKRDDRPIVAKRVWFSDGGIGSNLPLHMFDAMLPSHPTFAVNLKPAHPDHPIVEPEIPDNTGGRIYLATNQQGGRQRYWPTPDDRTALGGLLGFANGIIDTMQNWRDELMFPHAGYRDRIIQISQRHDEGGLNLDMPDDKLDALSQAGAMAAERLIDRFHESGREHGAGWEQHRDVRFRIFLGTLQPATAALVPTLSAGTWGPFLKDYGNAGRRALAAGFMQGVVGLGELGAAGQASLADDAPKPLPEVRITPKI